MRKMKLSFVGAALLISVLRTDAQEYGGSQSYSVSTNYNPQLPDNMLPGFPLPPPPPPREYTGYRVDTYGNPNPQYSPPPPPPSFFNNLWTTATSTAASLADKTASMFQDAAGTLRNWVGAQSDSSSRPYPPNSQVYYNGPRPVASRQVVASYPYYQPNPGRNQVLVPSTSYSGPPPPPPVSSQVVVSSDPYNRPPPPPVSSQVVVSSDPYNRPPPPPVSSQVGASSNNYNVPPPPPPPLASIQVSGSPDSNNGPPPANSQLYNVRMPPPPQNAM